MQDSGERNTCSLCSRARAPINAPHLQVLEDGGRGFRTWQSKSVVGVSLAHSARRDLSSM